MKWKQFTIETREEAEDEITYMLSELGITNTEIIDHKPIMDSDTIDLFEDVMPKLEPDDGKAKIVFYLEEDEDSGTVLRNVEKRLAEIAEYTEIGEGTISCGETADEDWANNWKAHFGAFYVDDILIKPTWVEKPADSRERFMIEIDPGSAFGTGSHETTKLCILGLKRELKPGDRVLDVGTGSGILSIAALKLGASYAFGTDIDELSVEASKENRARNGIGENEFEVALGDIISDRTLQEKVGFGCYDVVVSNILADVIVKLQQEVTAHLKRSGTLIVSGIIHTKASEVERALRENPELDVIGSETLGEWVSFTARKR